MRTGVRLVLMLFVAAAAIAQDEADLLPGDESEETIEPIRRYTVEFIVFTYGESVSAGTEIWIPEEPPVREYFAPIYGDFTDEFDEPLTEIQPPPIGRRYMDLELVVFGEEDFTMTEVYDKLVELEAYEPIVRAGWTQPTYERDLTASIPLNALVESPPWIDGELKLYLGRYLHLVVDLTMDSDRVGSDESDEDNDAELTFGDARIQNEYGPIDAYGELVQPRIRYRIFEDRIVKNGDVRYFDHPKFGVIAKVTRYEEPEEEEFVDDTDDLLPG